MSEYANRLAFQLGRRACSDYIAALLVGLSCRLTMGDMISKPFSQLWRSYQCALKGIVS